MSDVKSVIKDLENFSLKELKDLKSACEEQIVVAEKKEKSETLQAMRDLAESKGIDFEDLMADMGLGKRQGGRKKQQLPAKYMHPSDSTKTWTGRGRKPQWLRDLEAEGRNSDDFLIAS